MVSSAVYVFVVYNKTDLPSRVLFSRRSKVNEVITNIISENTRTFEETTFCLISHVSLILYLKATSGYWHEVDRLVGLAIWKNEEKSISHALVFTRDLEVDSGSDRACWFQCNSIFIRHFSNTFIGRNFLICSPKKCQWEFGYNRWKNIRHWYFAIISSKVQVHRKSRLNTCITINTHFSGMSANLYMYKVLWCQEMKISMQPVHKIIHGRSISLTNLPQE